MSKNIPELKTANLFDLNQTIAKALFDNYEYPFEVLPHIRSFIIKLGATLPLDEYQKIGEDIWISKTVVIPSSVSINGPLIIDHNAEIRHNAYIRGNVIIGQRAVVGNSVELKNTILFNEAIVPHFNYAGDSILGYQAHLGAGVITSNVKSDHSLITINYNEEKIITNLIKLGAIIGDQVEVGCNAVLNPGTVIGLGSSIYPLVSVRGYISPKCIVKDSKTIVKKL